jgi:hypothetical protein
VSSYRVGQRRPYQPFALIVLPHGDVEAVIVSAACSTITAESPEGGDASGLTGQVVPDVQRLVTS